MPRITTSWFLMRWTFKANSFTQLIFNSPRFAEIPPTNIRSLPSFLKLQTTTEVRVFVQFHSNRTVAPDNRHWQQVPWKVAFWRDSPGDIFMVYSLLQHIRNEHVVTTCVHFFQLPMIPNDSNIGKLKANFERFFCCPRQELSIQDFGIGNPGRH